MSKVKQLAAFIYESIKPNPANEGLQAHWKAALGSTGLLKQDDDRSAKD